MVHGMADEAEKARKDEPGRAEVEKGGGAILMRASTRRLFNSWRLSYRRGLRGEIANPPFSGLVTPYSHPIPTLFLTTMSRDSLAAGDDLDDNRPLICKESACYSMPHSTLLKPSPEFCT